MATDYDAFVANKLRLSPPTGIQYAPKLGEHLFPWQRELVTWACRRGRAALFADTGLGKSRMQLEWARAVSRHAMGGRVLILAPLAVAHQTVREGARIGIDVAYAREPSELGTISITNYERLDRFAPEGGVPEFVGVVLDESSILKSYSGSTKRALLERFAETPFKLACTATPAPNDHLELGNHAEFLRVLSSHEMIARWFINDTSAFGSYRLKGHAVEPFWDWVSSWAACIGRPSDMGYPDDGYDLPALELVPEVVDVDVTADRAGALFRTPELSATAVHAEKRRTAPARAARVAEVLHSEPGEPWIVWCETDYDADEVLARVRDAVDLRGSDSADVKEAKLIDFSEGRIRVLVTKPRIAGFGLNWQHCARMAFAGATFSYEGFYQAVRRCWRFGQRRPVRAHVAMASTELSVFSVMKRKQAEHEAMKREMHAAMRRARAVHDESAKLYRPTHEGRLPAWIK